MNKDSLHTSVTVYVFLFIVAIVIFALLSAGEKASEDRERRAQSREQGQTSSHVPSSSGEVSSIPPHAKKYKLSFSLCPEEGSRMAKWTGCVRVTPTLKPQENAP